MKEPRNEDMNKYKLEQQFQFRKRKLKIKIRKFQENVRNVSNFVPKLIFFHPTRIVKNKW